ncbi:MULTISPECIES: CpaF/VirB11 family protein [Vagococcus]|uniref:General secretion pathway protein E n=1 Tax=Vagococcus fluvialis bH819 TaxID=1255619 RepID=A0A1X6WS19_9ENTE|nr:MULTISPECIES: CpaF/VirB11 family protein [Vagococcus]SLM87090.1 General secretion pathway protein E [Vagococcus fluvialis bH819]
MRIIKSENPEKAVVVNEPLKEPKKSFVPSFDFGKKSPVVEALTKDELVDFLTTDISGMEKPVSDDRLDAIRDDITTYYSKEVLDGLTDDTIRVNLVETVLKQYKAILGSDTKKAREKAEYIVRECVGTGVIEKILLDDRITDIGWNGKLLSVKTNDNKWIVEGEKVGITQKYMDQVVSKYAVANDLEINDGNPIFNGMFKNLRISATYQTNAPTGTTVAMRVARPRLALDRENFHHFAPDYMLEFFEKVVRTKSNIVISGETGTGKTEFQKLLLSFIDPIDRIVMIEDVQETHAQILFPDKDIFSWVTGNGLSISDLVSQSLRNEPRYIIVAETRDKEAYEMLKAILSGHSVITTLHAIDCRAIPRRFVNMCASGYDINEESVESDINRYFDFGCHIKSVKVDGKTIRYLNEVVEFNQNETVTLFKQKFVRGEFICEVGGELSEKFRERMHERFIEFEFPTEPEEIEDQTDDSVLLEVVE